MKARFLKSIVVSELYSNIVLNLENYRKNGFAFLQDDPSKYFEMDFQVDLGQLEQILSKDSSSEEEAINCLCMFEALPEITPYLARDERFWVYLTHTNLINYARARWPIPDEDEKAAAHIKTHFFARGERGIERDNAGSRLWWMAHICGRVEDMTISEALEVFLYRADVRANIIERPSTSQNTVLFSAIIRKLKGSFEGDKALFGREKFRAFMKELNLLGGFKLLDSLDALSIKDIVNTI